MSSGGTAHSSVTRLESDASASHGFEFCSWYALRTGRCVVNAFKGMSGAPTSRSKRSSVTEHGMAYGPRGLGSRSSNSSRGSDAHRGARESHVQGEVEQVVG